MVSLISSSNCFNESTFSLTELSVTIKFDNSEIFFSINEIFMSNLFILSLRKSSAFIYFSSNDICIVLISFKISSLKCIKSVFMLDAEEPGRVESVLVSAIYYSFC